jgi:glycosyltransferase involved in cell wall biosynthesis
VSGGRVLELLGPSTGGIRRHVDVLARELPAHGWDVVVAGPAGVMDGLETRATPVPVGSRPWAVVSAARRVRTLVAAERVDVVHAHGLTAGWVAVLARAGVPVVVTVHNAVLAESAGRAAPVLARLEARLPRRVAATLAVSPALADDLRRRSGVEVRAVVPARPAPVATRSAEEVRRIAGVPADAPMVVSVARLHPQKALGDLLAAFVDVRSRVPAARLVLVGDGPQRADLQAEATRLGLGGVAAFVGAQPDGPSWLAAADVVAMSSIWEGSPLVVAEALLLGRPLVATDVGDVAAVVVDGRTGRLVPPRAPSLLGAAIGDMLERPSEAATMAREGRAAASGRYGLPALVGAVAAVYDQVHQ